MPETKIGYAPDVGVTYVLARLDGEIGTYLALTGNSVNGSEAFRLGLATHFVDSSRIDQLLERLGGLENPDVKQINAAIEEFSDDVDAETLGVKEGTPSIVTGEIRKALDAAFSASSVEDIISNLENYLADSKQSPAVQKWAKETVEALNLRSPTSLRVSLEAIRRAGRDGHRLSDSFQMELGIATAFCVSLPFLCLPTHVLISNISSTVWRQPRLHHRREGRPPREDQDSPFLVSLFIIRR